MSKAGRRSGAFVSDDGSSPSFEANRRVSSRRESGLSNCPPSIAGGREGGPRVEGATRGSSLERGSERRI